MGQFMTFLSTSDVFAVQPARRYVTWAFTQGVASALSSASFITLMTLPIVGVPKVTETLLTNLQINKFRQIQYDKGYLIFIIAPYSFYLNPNNE